MTSHNKDEIWRTSLAVIWNFPKQLISISVDAERRLDDDRKKLAIAGTKEEEHKERGK